MILCKMVKEVNNTQGGADMASEVVKHSVINHNGNLYVQSISKEEMVYTTKAANALKFSNGPKGQSRLEGTLAQIADMTGFHSTHHPVNLNPYGDNVGFVFFNEEGTAAGVYNQNEFMDFFRQVKAWEKRGCEVEVSETIRTHSGDLQIARVVKEAE